MGVWLVHRRTWPTLSCSLYVISGLAWGCTGSLISELHWSVFTFSVRTTLSLLWSQSFFRNALLYLQFSDTHTHIHSLVPMPVHTQNCHSCRPPDLNTKAQMQMHTSKMQLCTHSHTHACKIHPMGLFSQYKIICNSSDLFLESC